MQSQEAGEGVKHGGGFRLPALVPNPQQQSPFWVLRRVTLKQVGGCPAAALRRGPRWARRHAGVQVNGGTVQLQHLAPSQHPDFCLSPGKQAIQDCRPPQACLLRKPR